VDWEARGGWRAGRVTTATAELGGVILQVTYDARLPNGRSSRWHAAHAIMQHLAGEVETSD